MARLIEIQDAQVCPSALTIQVHDVLLFYAAGGHVRTGGSALEMIGPFVPGILGTDGRILTPEGAPNTVAFRALRPGRSTIDVVTGAPWGAARTTSLQVIVER